MGRLQEIDKGKLADPSCCCHSIIADTALPQVDEKGRQHSYVLPCVYIDISACLRGDSNSFKSH